MVFFELVFEEWPVLADERVIAVSLSEIDTISLSDSGSESTGLDFLRFFLGGVCFIRDFFAGGGWSLDF